MGLLYMGLSRVRKLERRRVKKVRKKVKRRKHWRFPRRLKVVSCATFASMRSRSARRLSVCTPSVRLCHTYCALGWSSPKEQKIFCQSRESVQLVVEKRSGAMLSGRREAAMRNWKNQKLLMVFMMTMNNLTTNFVPDA